MPRSKNIVASKRRRKKILKHVKGCYGAKRRSYTIAKNTLEKSLLNSYIGRKKKKRDYRRLWILRINAYVRKFSKISYSKFIYLLKKKNNKLNRKVISYFSTECKNGYFLKKILKS
ncbi:MAG: 50S ribosomal protein L20 [Candidatus Shikimatogenerans bostrichidophilus]|nr:MAG: 50S ribosomal protein L20 [Candidatus Shikimatogenerans bostrichidophilus]